MISVDAALDEVMAAATPRPAVRLPLAAALGLHLAEPVVAGLDLPRWDNSAMDGFAVCSADLSPGEATLEVLETTAAGAVPQHAVRPGTCTRIMTGAPMPEGADAVVMVEHSTTVAEGRVRLSGPVRAGQHVRRRGEDIPTGSRVLEPGVCLGPAELGLLAALGLPSARVHRRPRVAILSTGDEVVEPGLPLGPGQIYSSNGAALAAMVVDAGGEPLDCGQAPDQPDALRDAVLRGSGADLVLSTGGVSAGDFDFVHRVLGEVGVELRFHKVAMQPGKPILFGMWGSVPYFGLPGNPVSCMVGFAEFVRPVLRGMLGAPRPFLPVLDARAGAPVRKAPGRALFVRVSLRRDAQGGLVATPVQTQSSGAVGSMVHADGLLPLSASAGDLAAGDPVRVQVLRWGFLDGAHPHLWAQAEGPAPEGGGPCC